MRQRPVRHKALAALQGELVGNFARVRELKSRNVLRTGVLRRDPPGSVKAKTGLPE